MKDKIHTSAVCPSVTLYFFHQPLQDKEPSVVSYANTAVTPGCLRSGYISQFVPLFVFTTASVQFSVTSKKGAVVILGWFHE